MANRRRAESSILDECLNQLHAGGTTVSECLENHPDHAPALLPLLALGVEMQEAMAPPAAEATFVSATKQRLLRRARLGARPSPETKKRRAGIRWPPRWSTRWAYVLASLLLTVGLVVSSFGVAQAAASSLPGDSLYSVKRGIEKAQLALSLTPAGDLELLSGFADKRIEEIETLLAAGRGGDLDIALGEYESILTLLTDLVAETGVDGDPGSLEHIQSRLEHHRQVLERVLAKFPEDSKQAEVIEHAIERSGHSSEVLETIRNGGSPSDIAPGKQDRESPGQGVGPDKTPGPPAENEEGSGKDHKPPGKPTSHKDDLPTKTPRPKPQKTPKPTSSTDE